MKEQRVRTSVQSPPSWQGNGEYLRRADPVSQRVFQRAERLQPRRLPAATIPSDKDRVTSYFLDELTGVSFGASMSWPPATSVNITRDGRLYSIDATIELRWRDLIVITQESEGSEPCTLALGRALRQSLRSQRPTARVGTSYHSPIMRTTSMPTGATDTTESVDNEGDSTSSSSPTVTRTTEGRNGKRLHSSRRTSDSLQNPFRWPPSPRTSSS